MEINKGGRGVNTTPPPAPAPPATPDAPSPAVAVTPSRDTPAPLQVQSSPEVPDTTASPTPVPSASVPPESSEASVSVSSDSPAEPSPVPLSPEVPGVSAPVSAVDRDSDSLVAPTVPPRTKSPAKHDSDHSSASSMSPGKPHNVASCTRTKDSEYESADELFEEAQGDKPPKSLLSDSQSAEEPVDTKPRIVSENIVPRINPEDSAAGYILEDTVSIVVPQDSVPSAVCEDSVSILVPENTGGTQEVDSGNTVNIEYQLPAAANEHTIGRLDILLNSSEFSEPEDKTVVCSPNNAIEVSNVVDETHSLESVQIVSEALNADRSTEVPKEAEQSSSQEVNSSEVVVLEDDLQVVSVPEKDIPTSGSIQEERLCSFSETSNFEQISDQSRPAVVGGDSALLTTDSTVGPERTSSSFEAFSRSDSIADDSFRTLDFEKQELEVCGLATAEENHNGLGVERGLLSVVDEIALNQERALSQELALSQEDLAWQPIHSSQEIPSIQECNIKESTESAKPDSSVANTNISPLVNSDLLVLPGLDDRVASETSPELYEISTTAQLGDKATVDCSNDPSTQSITISQTASEATITSAETVILASELSLSLSEQSSSIQTPSPTITEVVEDLSNSSPVVSVETSSLETQAEAPVDTSKDSSEAPNTNLPQPATGFPEEEIPIVPKKSYNLDFLDKLDDPNFNPFGTKTAIRNSPPPTPPSGVSLPPLKPAIRKKKGTASVSAKPVDAGPRVDESCDQTGVGEKGSSGKTDPLETKVVSSTPRDNASSAGASLEVAFDEGLAKKISTGPPKRLVKKSVQKSGAPTKKNAQEPASVTKSVAESADDTTARRALNNKASKGGRRQSAERESSANVPIPADPDNEIIVPSKGYNLDFLDNLDDPNFNPFNTKKTVSNSPPTGSGVPKVNEVDNCNNNIENTKFIDRENTINQPSELKCDLKSEPSHIPASKSGESNLNATNTLENENIIAPEKPTTPSVARQPVLKPTTSTPNGASIKPATTKPLTDNANVSPPDAVSSTTHHRPETGPPSGTSLKRIPSFGGISVSLLESCEFEQLLGSEASRLAEELTNHSLETSFADQTDNANWCSLSSQASAGRNYNNNPSQKFSNKQDSGLSEEEDPDIFSDCTDDSAIMSTGNRSGGSRNGLPARRSLNLEGGNDPQFRRGEGADPFRGGSKISRSPPPLGARRPVSVGAAADPFVPNRALRRDDDDQVTTSSLDSGLATSMCDGGSTDYANHSEAGPDIATGMTTSDLQAASQLESLELVVVDDLGDEDFLSPYSVFKDATELENQLRRTLGHGLGGHIKGSDGSPGAADKDKVCGGILTPPREERSAPEGTSSPTPRPSEAGDKRAQAPPPGYLSQAQVDALLKRQEAQFEERLQRVSHSTDQKEKELHSRMKEEQKELAELRSVVVEVTQSREALLKMLEQYKDMLAAVVKGKSTLDKGQEQRMKDLETQKNQALEDLANVEAAFSDVHRKYERTKQIVETMRRNEETLQGAVADYENKVKRQEATLITFQQHAEEKMQQAGDEYDRLKQNTDQELTKMGALLKKAEMKIISLQEQLDRKSRDNQELTQLLDDLIAKMGPST